MKTGLLILGVVLVLAVVAAVIAPLWISAAGFGLPGAGWLPLVLMVVLCFAVGGGLMFLMFFSARRGYDDDVYLGAVRGNDGEDDPPA